MPRAASLLGGVLRLLRRQLRLTTLLGLAGVLLLAASWAVGDSAQLGRAEITADAHTNSRHQSARSRTAEEWWRTCDARDAKPLPANASAADVDFARQGRRIYVERTGRCPPPGYAHWLLYARDRECELHDYRFVDRDLLPFRHHYAGKADLFRNLQSAMLAMVRSKEAKDRYRVDHASISGGAQSGDKLPMAYLSLVADAMHFLPDFHVFFSNLDEPRVMPSEREVMNDSFVEEFVRASAASRTGQGPFAGAPFFDVALNTSLDPSRAPLFKPIGDDAARKLTEGTIPAHSIARLDIMKKVLGPQCPSFVAHPRVAREVAVHGSFRCPVNFNVIPAMLPIFSATKPGGFMRELEIPRDMGALEARLAEGEAAADEWERRGGVIGKEPPAPPEPPDPPPDPASKANQPPVIVQVLPKQRLRRRDDGSAAAEGPVPAADPQDPSFFSPCFYDLLVPDPYNLRHLPPRQVPNPLTMPPWSAKDSTLVWRGATTGGFTSNSTCKEHHRHIGVGAVRDLEAQWAAERALGSKVPNITFDVGFSSIALCQNCAYIGQRYGPSRGRIAFRDHFRAKYLLDMDGNSYSQRFELFLFGDSLGIRAGVHEAWYEGWIRPWEHYVPLRVDFSDLEEKLRWLAEHDDVARRIARNGQRTAWRRMRTADKQCYLSRLFLEYGHIGEELYYDV